MNTEIFSFAFIKLKLNALKIWNVMNSWSRPLSLVVVRVFLVFDLAFCLNCFGLVVGTYESCLLFCEQRLGGGSTWRWWGHLNTTCCNWSSFNFLWSRVVGTQKPRLDWPCTSHTPCTTRTTCTPHIPLHPLHPPAPLVPLCPWTLEPLHPLHSCTLHPLCPWVYEPLHPSHPCTPCTLCALASSHTLHPCDLAPIASLHLTPLAPHASSRTPGWATLRNFHYLVFRKLCW